MSHAHEIDSSRPLSHAQLRRLIVTCLLLLALTVFGVAHTLMPNLLPRLHLWGNDQVAKGLGLLHQTTTKAETTDWQDKLDEAKKAAQQALEPVEVYEALPDEVFDYAEDSQLEQH